MRSSRKIHYSRRALRNIKQALNCANGEYETGGLLLGRRILFGYCVVDITAPADVVEKSAISFVLDGGYHQREAEKIAENYRLKLSVLGIWHSHLYDGARFSEADREINYQFSQLLNGTLSAIAVQNTPSDDFSVVTYHIAQNGRIQALG